MSGILNKQVELSMEPSEWLKSRGWKKGTRWDWLYEENIPVAFKYLNTVWSVFIKYPDDPEKMETIIYKENFPWYYAERGDGRIQGILDQLNRKLATIDPKLKV